ncbi:Hypothetical_protein [Hexamita inflata]|uniref:Hypothetical_protein n=1 Tax=Hexamita inflata TaxID=28002 RepID=A0AA86NSW2_9EUKA|nr:Hypothetical protein HINF_LOCUS12204 [Hexamita inflata]
MYIKALYSLKPVIDQFCPEISAFRVQSPCEPFYGNSEQYRSFDALIDDFKYSSFYSKNLDLSDFLQKIDSFGTYLIFTNADLKINHKLLKSVYKNANILLIQFHSSNQQFNLFKSVQFNLIEEVASTAKNPNLVRAVSVFGDLPDVFRNQ